MPYRHPKFKFVLDLRAFRKRGEGKRRLFFKTRAEAAAEAYRQRTLLERHSRQAVGLSQREMSELIRARERMAKYPGKTITDAVDFFVNHLERVRRHGITVSQLSDEVLEAKRRDGKAPAYIADLRKRLNRFSQTFGSRAISGVGVEEIDNWLRDLPLSPKSRANYRANIGVLFSYAFRRRILDHNPILHTARPKLIDRPPDIFNVDELRSLLEAANKVAADIVPLLAIGAFAGLREAEIQRLDWSEIDLARGHIEVTAAKAKSARRRIVPIQPNLAAWLRPSSGQTGRVVPSNARKKLNRTRKAAGLARWPNNGLRHSFASYRLAAIHDAPRVAAELGHSSPQMLYSTYREVVKPEEASAYWNIEPALESERVVAFHNQ